MSRIVGCIWIGLVLVGCEPLEVGDPPSFGGATSVQAISASQVEVRWQPGSDDLLEPEELSYGIWFSADGAVNTEDAADIVTDEGALSYNLIDLAPETEYRVLVRALDRGTNYSENTQTRSVTTPATGAGRFSAPTTFNLNAEPSLLRTGRVLTGSRDDVAVMTNNRIAWFLSEASGTVNRLSDDLQFSETIRDAQLAALRSETNLDDLLVLTDSGLTYYERVAETPTQSVPFETGLAPFAGNNPLRELNVVVDDLGFESLSYLDDSGVLRFYEFDTDTEAFELIREIQLGTDVTHYRATDVDGDGIADVVYLDAAGLQVALAEDETYQLGVERLVDGFLVDNDSQVELILHDGNHDGLVDIYLFERNRGEDLTRMLAFGNLGDGDFDTGIETDYAGAFLEKPRLADATGDGLLDLILVQTAANNTAVYQAATGQLAFTSLWGYIGGDGEPLFADFGNFDGRLGADGLLISRQSDGGYELRIWFDNP